MIVRVVKLTFKMEDIPAFLELFEESKSKISSFPGLNHLELCRSEADESIYFTISRWSNEEQLEQYRSSDFFKKTWHQVRQYFNEKPEAWTLGSIESIGTWQ